MIYDVGIIGAGVAGCFASLRLADKHPNVKTIVFDIGKGFQKRRRQLEGALGSFPASDGKLYTNDFDKITELTDGRKTKPIKQWVEDHLNEAGSNKKLIKDSLPNVSVQKKLKEDNFKIIANNYFQWKPESIHQLSKNMIDILEKNSNITFNFDTEVYSIIKKKNIFEVSTSLGDFSCKKIILASGRSGWRWTTNLYKNLGLSFEDDCARFGVRVELSGQYMKDFNKSHCTLIKDDLEIGPLSWNGTVIPEDHADLVISAFRSNEDRWKSEKVSFSLIKTVHFKNEGVKQTNRLARLAFLLFNDKVSKEKIKLLLKGDSQLNLLPEYNWLPKTLEELNKYIPNLLNRGYFHVPTIITVPSKINLNSSLESELDGLFVVGENAGEIGILFAAMSGAIAADSVCK